MSVLDLSDLEVFVLESIFAFFFILLLIWQIKGLRSRYSSMVAISSITTNILLLMASFVAVFEHILQFYSAFDSKGCFLENIFFLLLMSGRTVVYCYWLSRCFQIFNGSIFRLRKKTIIAVALIVILPNIVFPSVLFIVKSFQMMNVNGNDVHRISECISWQLTFAHTWIEWISVMYICMVDIIFTLALIRLFAHHFHILDLSNNHFRKQFEYHSTTDSMKKLYDRHSQANDIYIAIGRRTTVSLIGNIIASVISILAFNLNVFQFRQSLLLLSAFILMISTVISYTFAIKLYSVLCCCDGYCHYCWTLLCFCCSIPDELPAKYMDKFQISATNKSSKTKSKKVMTEYKNSEYTESLHSSCKNFPRLKVIAMQSIDNCALDGPGIHQFRSHRKISNTATDEFIYQLDIPLSCSLNNTLDISAAMTSTTQNNIESTCTNSRNDSATGMLMVTRNIQRYDSCSSTDIIPPATPPVSDCQSF